MPLTQLPRSCSSFLPQLADTRKRCSLAACLGITVMQAFQILILYFCSHSPTVDSTGSAKKPTNQPKKTPNCIKGNALIFLVRIIIHTVAITLAFAKTWWYLTAGFSSSTVIKLLFPTCCLQSFVNELSCFLAFHLVMCVFQLSSRRWGGACLSTCMYEG